MQSVYDSFFKLVVCAINPNNLDDFLIKELKDFNNLFKIYKISAERSIGESEFQDNTYSPFSSLLSKLFEEDINFIKYFISFEKYSKTISNIGRRS